MERPSAGVVHHRARLQPATITRLFRLTIMLKGIFAVIEILGGAAMHFVNPALLMGLVADLTQDELTEDPNDLVATYLRNAAEQFLSVGTRWFIVLYLVSHGVIKLLVIIALLLDKLWAYPAAIVVFSGFIVYQVYRYTFEPGIGLIILTVIDLIVIWLTWHEYRQHTLSRVTPGDVR